MPYEITQCYLPPSRCENLATIYIIFSAFIALTVMVYWFIDLYCISVWW